MARLPRLAVPGEVHAIGLRGNNGQPVFLDSTDREQALMVLQAQAARELVLVHAYALTETSLHLLLTPPSQEALTRFMQGVGRSYVRAFNQRHGRSGTLWEGRYRSTVLQASGYLLDAMALLDSLPVLKHEATAPQESRWTSYAHYTGARTEKWLTTHAQVWALGNTPFAREVAYAEWVARQCGSRAQRVLLEQFHKGWALGDAAFLEALAQATGRRVSKDKPGRPRRISVPN